MLFCRCPKTKSTEASKHKWAISQATKQLSILAVWRVWNWGLWDVSLHSRDLFLPISDPGVSLFGPSKCSNRQCYVLEEWAWSIGMRPSRCLARVAAVEGMATSFQTVGGFVIQQTSNVVQVIEWVFQSSMLSSSLCAKNCPPQDMIVCQTNSTQSIWFQVSKDWGGASFAPISMTLAGSWMGAEPSFLLEHEEKMCLGHSFRGENYCTSYVWNLERSLQLSPSQKWKWMENDLLVNEILEDIHFPHPW